MQRAQSKRSMLSSPRPFSGETAISSCTLLTSQLRVHRLLNYWEPEVNLLRSFVTLFFAVPPLRVSSMKTHNRKSYKAICVSFTVRCHMEQIISAAKSTEPRHKVETKTYKITLHYRRTRAYASLDTEKHRHNASEWLHGFIVQILRLVPQRSRGGLTREQNSLVSLPAHNEHQYEISKYECLT